jgi:hypothetical protein
MKSGAVGVPRKRDDRAELSPTQADRSGGNTLQPDNRRLQSSPHPTFSGGSQQLRLFRRAMRDGASIEDAALNAGISIGEARIHAQADARFPPPPEAYQLLYDPDAPVAASSAAKEDDMAGRRRAREPEETFDTEAGEGGGIDGEYSRPDANLAFEIYDKQIAPKLTHLATLKGDLSQPYQDIKDQAHFPRDVLNFIVKLEDTEDAKRDHKLLALAEGLKARNLFLPRDLVTIANGDDGEDIVPSGERERPALATLADDDDDGDDGGADIFDEADEEELAAQEGRGRKRAKPAAGTGAAAIEAMKAAAQASATVN